MIKGDEIIAKIHTKNAKVTIIGGGYVGLPLAVRCANVGYKVTVFDINRNKVDSILAGKSYIGDIQDDQLTNPVDGQPILFATSDPIIAMRDPDIVIICVPTPLNKTKDPDVTMVMDSVRMIRVNSPHPCPERLVILESTVYPGLTREAMVPELTTDGKLSLDTNLMVAFSPERVDPSNERFGVQNTPKVVGGIDKESSVVATLFYSVLVSEIIPVSSCDAAEMAKVIENTFRMVNIALANETALECEKLGLDVWEVIGAAATKPFGFMPFWPGPGVGGHCLDENEWIYYRYNGQINLDQVWKIWNKFCFNDINAVNVPGLELLSIDEKGKIEWNKVTSFSKRCFSGNMINIKTNYGYKLCITEDHPMLVLDGDKFNIIEATKLQINNRIPFLYKNITNNTFIPFIDVLKSIPENRINRLRIKLKNHTWSEFKKEIYSICNNDKKYDFISNNYLPADLFIKLEECHGFNLRNKANIVTGRGPSYSSIPAIINFDNDFSRLVGYFLSEGCLTEEKHIPRVRLTFGTHEKEYIEDVKSILNKMGISFSTYIQDNSFHIRISSSILGFVLRDVLGCGCDCYNKKIPSVCFDLPQEQKKNLLGALIKGDGFCGGSIGKKICKKGNKIYFHNCNSAQISFFSSSEYLARGVVFLIQSLGILARVHRNESGFFVEVGGGTSAVYNCIDFLGERKCEKIKEIFKSRIRNVEARNVKRHGEITSVAITNIVKEKVTNREVFSFDVENSHTFCSGFGCFVHNCISLDPHYLAWKLRGLNYRSRFIELAEQINSSMPEHVVRMVVDALSKKCQKALCGANILVLGVAYKSNVSDVRESPALDVIRLLMEGGAKVSFHDPYVESIYLEHSNENMRRVDDPISAAKFSDCVLVVTNHKIVDYHQICSVAKLIVDSRNATKGLRSKFSSKIVVL